jgi:hypothetical protein
MSGVPLATIGPGPDRTPIRSSRPCAALPPTAIGKDFPYDNAMFGRTPSGTGIRASLGGYLGLTVGWVEGIEINFLGAVIGIDLRRPALKLPGLGRIGFIPA